LANKGGGLKKDLKDFSWQLTVKVKIDKHESERRCRICKNREETVTHIISECSKLVQPEYKKRHDKVTEAVNWSLCETYHIKRSEHWYQHTAKPVIETENEDPLEHKCPLGPCD